MDVKNMEKEQSVVSRKHSQLVQLAVICLAGVSLFTTAQGMTQYIFDNGAVAYAASTAIQGILLAMSMGLPEYLRRIWKNKWHVLLRLIVCAIIIILTFVTMFCSSWFSYIYIADVVHFDSWGTDSKLLVQQTYRTELYDARDYAHIYRTYLEGDMGEKILMLEDQATIISKSESLNTNINWAQERIDYGNPNTTAGAYMATAIEAMVQAMQDGSSGNARDRAVVAVADARNNISERMEVISQRLSEIDSRITGYNAQITSLTNRINNAVAGTDTTSLTNSLNSYVQRIESETADQTALQEEYNQLDVASGRLQLYESELGLNNASSSVAIRNALLEMQTEFFQEDPNEDELLATATSIFENLRNAASYNDNNNFSYTELLVQMNQLILNLKDYSDIKNVESSLEDMIAWLRDEENADLVNEEWKGVWRNHLERLKFQISAMPAYSAEQATNEEESDILTDSQFNTLRNYDRNKSSNRLDDMIRLYIAEHNALYQGIIYLRSPYRMLALFSLILAFSFDLSGFILGFINQGEEGRRENNSIGSMLTTEVEKWRTRRVKNDADWSIISSLNKYKILTGDYEKKDQIYVYQVFANGLLEKWDVTDPIPYVQGIYQQDHAIETKGTLVSASRQNILFASQPGGPIDGVYLNCRLEFEEGSLLLVEKVNQREVRSFLVNVNEYVPVHSYSPSKGESQTIPAEQLSRDKIEVQMAVLALNTKGTRIAAIYIMEL